MPNYALIKDGLIQNVVVWDGVGDLFKDFETYELAENYSVGPGYAADMDSAGKWIFTAPAVVITPEEQGAINLQKAQTEYARATTQITSLNERIEDSDYAGTTEDAVKLSLSDWVTYRKALRAYISSVDGGIELPSAPDV